MKHAIFAAATAVAACVAAGAASAATLNIVGGTTIASVPTNFGVLRDVNGSLGFALGAGPADLTAPLKAFTNNSTDGHGLRAVDGDGDGRVKITLTYLGYEAGNSNIGGERPVSLNNYFSSATSVSGDTFSFFDNASEGLGRIIDLFFRTDGRYTNGCTQINNGRYDTSRGTGCKLAFSSIFGDGTMTYAMFGDGAGDSDLDDLVFKVTVSEVPIPAAGFLLLGALGGLAALRRRKTA